MLRLVSAVALAFALCHVAAPAVARADGCYNCASGSTCNQCRYGDNKNETFDTRKACEKAGCKVTGTGSCSTAANVKRCEPKK